MVINRPRNSLRLLTLPVLCTLASNIVHSAISNKVNYKSFILIINHVFGCFYYIFIYYTVHTTKFNLLGKLQVPLSVITQSFSPEKRRLCATVTALSSNVLSEC